MNADGAGLESGGNSTLGNNGNSSDYVWSRRNWMKISRNGLKVKREKCGFVTRFGIL